METIENIIHALRCSNTPFSAGDERKCEECVYATTEFFEGHKWVSCDCERIGLDAAEALEKLTEGRNNG